MADHDISKRQMRRKRLLDGPLEDSRVAKRSRVETRSEKAKSSSAGGQDESRCRKREYGDDTYDFLICKLFYSDGMNWAQVLRAYLTQPGAASMTRRAIQYRGLALAKKIREDPCILPPQYASLAQDIALKNDVLNQLPARSRLTKNIVQRMTKHESVAFPVSPNFQANIAQSDASTAQSLQTAKVAGKSSQLSSDNPRKRKRQQSTRSSNKRVRNTHSGSDTASEFRDWEALGVCSIGDEENEVKNKGSDEIDEQVVTQNHELCTEQAQPYEGDLLMNTFLSEIASLGDLARTQIILALERRPSFASSDSSGAFPENSHLPDAEPPYAYGHAFTNEGDPSYLALDPSLLRKSDPVYKFHVLERCKKTGTEAWACPEFGPSEFLSLEHANEFAYRLATNHSNTHIPEKPKLGKKCVQHYWDRSDLPIYKCQQGRKSWSVRVVKDVRSPEAWRWEVLATVLDYSDFELTEAITSLQAFDVSDVEGQRWGDFATLHEANRQAAKLYFSMKRTVERGRINAQYSSKKVEVLELEVQFEENILVENLNAINQPFNKLMIVSGEEAICYWVRRMPADRTSSPSPEPSYVYELSK
jgi:hypothetical protein